MSKGLAVDWKAVIGFCGVLVIIVAIGVIGIKQIQDLSDVVNRLATVDIPRHNAILNIKSINSRYAMGIRSYIFWRQSRYLEAAGMSNSLGTLKISVEDLEKDIIIYESKAMNQDEKKWAVYIRGNQKNLWDIGQKIIKMVDSLAASEGEYKNKLGESISSMLMVFENAIFRTEAFLDDPMQKFNQEQIRLRLINAEDGRRHSILFLWTSLFVGVLFGAETFRIIYIRSQKEKEYREFLTRKVIRIEEEERNNLSLQVHDQMGQDLSALKIFLGLIDVDLPADAGPLKEKIKKTKDILDALMVKAHNISELLRPPELDDLGLVESIAALIMQQQRMMNIDYDFKKPIFEMKVSSECSLLLYRVVQEAITNINKYSNASHVEIVLEVGGDNVMLRIKDDGVGFDYDEYLKHPGRRRDDKMKLGLQGLRERIELLGGTIKIISSSGKGTHLEVVLPKIF